MTVDGQRKYDLVAFGATSFVGRLLCEYLDQRLAESNIAWAIAGRDERRLQQVKETLKTDVDVIIADSHDSASLSDLVRSTAVVVSTVGPYATHGSVLVELAADAGTDYCDLTGEPQWMRKMIDEHNDSAVASGARIVHACGFDSIPSDLGVAYTQERSITSFGSPCSQISLRVKALRGGVSGGTVASMFTAVDETSKDAEARQILANPYSLAPAGMREGVPQAQFFAPMHDQASGAWIAPFVMAAVNTRVVHRSHALAGRPWGEDFLYDEAVMTGEGPQGLSRAAITSIGLGGLAVGATSKRVRDMLVGRVLPKPGDGPTREQQVDGFFDLRLYGTTANGDTITTKVTGDRDPGYASTAKMLGEASIALAQTDPADKPGGFWTPATMFGTDLIENLETHAGLSFTTIKTVSGEPA